MLSAQRKEEKKTFIFFGIPIAMKQTIKVLFLHVFNIIVTFFGFYFNVFYQIFCRVLFQFMLMKGAQPVELCLCTCEMHSRLALDIRRDPMSHILYIAYSMSNCDRTIAKIIVFLFAVFSFTYWFLALAN